MANLGKVVRVMEVLPVTASEGAAVREADVEPQSPAVQDVVTEEVVTAEARESVSV